MSARSCANTSVVRSPCFCYLMKIDLFKILVIVPSSFLKVHFSKVILLPDTHWFKKVQTQLSLPLHGLDGTRENPVPEKYIVPAVISKCRSFSIYPFLLASKTVSYLTLLKRKDISPRRLVSFSRVALLNLMSN